MGWHFLREKVEKVFKLIQTSNLTIRPTISKLIQSESQKKTKVKKSNFLKFYFLSYFFQYFQYPNLLKHRGSCLYVPLNLSNYYKTKRQVSLYFKKTVNFGNFGLF